VTGHGCCEGARTPSRRFPRRFFEAAGCVMPGALVALLPKCPACLAAWLALATGVGVSAPAAGVLRTAVLALSVAPLIWLAVRTRGVAQRSLTFAARMGALADHVLARFLLLFRARGGRKGVDVTGP
jgi:hypothetical protein